MTHGSIKMVKFETCGSTGGKISDIFIAPAHVIAVVPYPASSTKIAMCFISVVGGDKPTLVLGHATDAVVKLGFTVK